MHAELVAPVAEPVSSSDYWSKLFSIKCQVRSISGFAGRRVCGSHSALPFQLKRSHRQYRHEWACLYSTLCMEDEIWISYNSHRHEMLFFFWCFFQSLKDGTQIFSVCVAQNQMTGLARGPRLSQRTLLRRPADASLACPCTCAEPCPPPRPVRGGDRPAWDLAPRDPLDRVSPRVSHVLRARSTLPRLP